MRKLTECIFCHKDAVLKTSKRTIQRGLIKVEVPQRNYECTSCKRTFRTREQILEDGDLKKIPVTPIQNKGHRFITPNNGDTTKDND